MKKIYMTLLGVLFSLLIMSQERQKSDIYNNKGQLRVDTTLSISQKQFEVWYRAEGNILAYLSGSIEYVRFAHENGIEGRFIVAFFCDTFDVKDIRLLNKDRIGGGLEESVIINLKDNGSKDIISELKYTVKLYNNLGCDFIENQFIGTYYLPIDFSLIDYREYLKKENALPIIRSAKGIISSYSLDPAATEE